MRITQSELQARVAESSAQIIVQLLEVVTANETVRLVADENDLETPWGTFQRFPFELTTLSASETKPPQIKFSCDTVDTRIIQELRKVAGQKDDVLLRFRMVDAANPSDIKYGPSTFKFSNMDTDGFTSCTLTGTFMASALSDTFPSQQISPANAGS
ncbi:DUF1833 family protein [Salinisphaera sp. LB1]|uniref:DUF1833 family protein n=1 Tax=Salinisphaera sp. LB1 TaxID=2183911 RepID=UPI000D705F6A|nr:DUF1833 family protein [Salinisphaera sp. LB1]